MAAIGKSIDRTYIGTEYDDVCQIPDLIGIQKDSYENFLQNKKLLDGVVLDEKCGLEEVFNTIFPISYKTTQKRKLKKSYPNDQGVEEETEVEEEHDIEVNLEYEPPYTIEFDNIKYSELECKKKGRTYSFPLKANFLLEVTDYVTVRRTLDGHVIDKKTDNHILEKEIFLGDIPIMTDRGTFIVNGAERVVVSQIHRSPGVIFTIEKNATKNTNFYSSRIIPYRGSWLEFEIDEKRSVIAAKIDRKKKILGTLFLRAIGINTREKIIASFYKTESAKLTPETVQSLVGRYPAKDIYVEIEGKQEKIFQAGTIFNEHDLTLLLNQGVEDIELVDLAAEGSLHSEMILNCLKAEEKYTDISKSDEPTKEDVLSHIYSVLMPGEMITTERGEKELPEMFFSSRRYDLGAVGRYKLHKKFHAGEDNDNFDENLTVLTPQDITDTMSFLIKVFIKEENIDDIDHLGNRRVRCVGELLQQQMKAAFSRLERVVRERLNSTSDFNMLKPQDLISNKPVVGAIKEFFGSSQFSQFMDQINPLAELTHKRRLTALGSGGLNRDRAGFEVRDVHYTHYGRMCPIETPEGPNIGLIVSLANYTRINKFGFLETPYRKVVDGKATKEVRFLDAYDEEKFNIAQGNAKLNKDGSFADEYISTRRKGDYSAQKAKDIQYMDVSPRQVVSVAASLIPFLEHDDANRALMGSNMQRQAVPLVFPEAPRVGTGMEHKAAYDSGVMVKAKEDGTVFYVSSEMILTAPPTYRVVETEGKEPTVTKLQQVSKTDLVASGIKAGLSGYVVHASTKMVIIAPETAVVEKEFNIESRTVVGDIRLVASPRKFIGAGSVLATVETKENGGKKETVEIKSPIAGYILSLSAEKAVILPVYQYVIQKYQRTNQDTCFTQIPIVNYGDFVRHGDVLADGPATDRGDLALGRNLLVGFVPWNGYNYEDAVLISERVVKEDIYTSIHIHEFTIDVRETKLGNEKTTKDIPNTSEEMTHFLSDEGIIAIGTMVHPGSILVGKVTPKSESDTTPEFKLLNSIFGEKAKEVRDTSLKVPHGTEGIVIDVQRLKKSDSDELAPGVEETIKVLIATKRKLKQGDKMAGRHGNKGVVSRILPEEDMPFMEDGTPLDVCLNPLGVPSRMNIGQLMETQLGWAAVKLDEWYNSPVFQSATMEKIEEKMVEAGLPKTSKTTLYDGRTGVAFVNPVFCGYIYYLKLHHLVDDKMHARSTGPYSLVTQQPLGGKAQFGGQRLGEMEVWALEAYGAANTLQEMLTIKSDDMNGRVKIYESIVKGEPSSSAGMPEAFNVLVQEIRGLALDMSVYDSKGKQVALTERDEEIISKKNLDNREVK